MILMVIVELCVCACVWMDVCECMHGLVKRNYTILFLVYIMLVATHFP